MILLIVFELIVAVGYAGITALLMSVQYHDHAVTLTSFRKHLMYALFVWIVLIIIEVVVFY
ncbi:hypothetical protein AYR62_09970 [Secundilactobacillus paracollinoides]|uniref:Uncharacterized protein n=1 Tax=Secundilactobacillus paracollinoides TaxID=240427 RepID=A0A1B2IYS4_9LACO|nr:hypothetical protein [Secundilactobacillus paracollinoides]ANZ61236.1 hypothetical protein AYR61_07665 [Secundilactobacillus paracollinoides]ANZ64370.1 hypothetical protein AYR62_09970 [Secundilactobacillus paracollinoides]ANZ67158.1 hypothetical protein AYR63_08415 [Secundilactobacillus paracollinoides]KRL76159.1 hypothetical protein FC17_GL002211 [Secundilactobacillus paracollinoides DSM 15502 = JCM 11969]